MRDGVCGTHCFQTGANVQIELFVFVFVFEAHTECKLKAIIFLSLCYIPSSEARCGVNLMIENQIVRTMATAFSSQMICQMIKMHCLYDQFYTGGYSFKKRLAIARNNFCFVKKNCSIELGD